MSDYRRIRRRQILREAEGYLELATVFDDRWPVRIETRDRLCRRGLETLAQLDTEDADRFQSLFLSGQILRVMERHLEALVPLEQAAAKQPENMHVRLALGWCYKRCNRLDLAIDALEKAVAVKPNVAIVNYNLACYRSLDGDAPAALFYLKRAIEIEPHYRDLATTEHDFDPLRQRPDFQDLTAVVV